MIDHYNNENNTYNDEILFIHYFPLTNANFFKIKTHHFDQSYNKSIHN